MGTAGGLIGAGDAAFVGAIVPMLAFGPKDSILALDVGGPRLGVDPGAEPDPGARAQRRPVC